MRRNAASLAAVLAVLALLAGCGSSKSSSDGSSGAKASSSSAYGGGGGATTDAQPTTTAAASTAATLMTTSGKHGTYLADASGRVVYLWEKDKTTKSECNDACAQAWPPVTTSTAPHAGGKVNASMLGMTKRADGTTQVTYNGHPLYYYAEDEQPGQTKGQGSKEFGAGWYVLTAKGKKIDDD